jgi:hypothetical protein
LCACNQSAKKGNSSNDKLKELQVLSDQMITEKFSLPLIDILIDFNEVGIQYRAKEVNPYVNIRKYNSQRAKELNLGVFMADFIYLASLNHQLNLSEYLNNIQILLSDLDIAGVLDKDTYKRYEAGVATPDSIYNLSIEIQYKMLDNLVGNNREDVYVNIGIGGFVESFYLFLRPIETEEQFMRVEMEMENYRFAFNEYIDAAKRIGANLYLKETLSDLSPLLRELDKLSIKKTPHKTENTPEGNVHVTGGEKLNVTYKEFTKIRQELIEVRTKFISIN